MAQRCMASWARRNALGVVGAAASARPGDGVVIEVERDLADPECHGREVAVDVRESVMWRGMNQIDFRFVAVVPKTDIADVDSSHRYASADRTPPGFGGTEFP